MTKPMHAWTFYRDGRIFGYAMDDNMPTTAMALMHHMRDLGVTIKYVLAGDARGALDAEWERRDKL